MSSIGKILICIGIMMIVVGAIIMISAKFFNGRGAPLPGDVFIRRGNFTFYFPVVTSIAISVILTLIFWLISHIFKGQPPPSR